MSFLDLDENVDDGDEYDEFLFQSIKRYNVLQMFHLENIPCNLFQMDNSSICVASKRSKGNNSEILKLQLPGKLLLPIEEESRCKENDFKILSGLYTENSIYKVDKLGQNDQIITSEHDTSGLKIYSFGNKSQEHNINTIPWKRLEFVVINESNNLICSKCNHEPLVQVDLCTGTKVKDIRHPFYTFDILPHNWEVKTEPCNINNIKSQVLGKDLIAVLNTYSGEVVLHDLRTDNCFIPLPRLAEKQSKEIWTISGYDLALQSLNYFGVVSNKKSFCIYERRKNSILIESKSDDCPVENCSNLKLKFCESGEQFSISGINSTVEIFKINKGDYKQVFTHNGHCSSYSSSNVVTDHIWLIACGKELVISICDNKTLHCWDFNSQLS